jgi:hypothetical protein
MGLAEDPQIDRREDIQADHTDHLQRDHVDRLQAVTNLDENIDVSPPVIEFLDTL